jgi:hypothetical protein
MRKSAESAIATLRAMEEDKNPLILRGLEMLYKYREYIYFNEDESAYFNEVVCSILRRGIPIFTSN